MRHRARGSTSDRSTESRNYDGGIILIRQPKAATFPCLGEGFRQKYGEPKMYLVLLSLPHYTLRANVEKLKGTIL